MSTMRYTYILRFDKNGGQWHIIDMGDKGYCSLPSDPIVWSMPWKPEHASLGEPPPEFREKYEALLSEAGWKPWAEDEYINIVELVADQDDCAFDQPCVHGYRVEKHAVYCHNKSWLYAPGKCRRHHGSSVWGEEPWPHEQCPGFKANPLYKE